MAEPLRVLELLVSTGPGGGPAHVLELVSRLPRAEFEVTVAGPGAGVYAERFRAAGAAFVECATDRLSLRALGKVRRIVSGKRIGLVHSHGKGAGLYGRLAAPAHSWVRRAIDGPAGTTVPPNQAVIYKRNLSSLLAYKWFRGDDQKQRLIATRHQRRGVM